ncbi:CotH protein [Planctomycetes bacterium Pla163]|uniref:CotH protein n=1 Tax=Rohdeia mirabilis TaxID=2528008 RepID=A0A518CZL0_9BACT|nr:CotH protein [Planctomycetes bacterium Pla163]
MLLKRPDTDGTGVWTGLVLLGLGVVIGVLLAPFEWIASDSGGAVLEPTAEVRHLEAFLVPNEAPPPAPENGLDTLDFELTPEAAARIQDVRERAMSRGIIVQSDDDTVPMQLAFEGKTLNGTVRIKGDWTDHVDTDQWSLRVELKDGKILGMSTFSIQHPKTRGWLWEWFVLAAARREGLLAPRSTFVNVAINGNPLGIYYLEEHFSKELLESQGRREGPIVLWDEGTRWSTLLQARNVPPKGVELPVPLTASSVWSVDPAYVRAFKEKRLDGSDALARSFYSAVEKMRELQALAVSATTSHDALRRLEALDRVQGESIDTILAVDRLADMHALASLFQLQHPLIWHNMRFYHDPVLNRLEPILFDTDADHPGPRDPVVMRESALMREFGRSRTYYDGVFERLGHYCRPEYVNELMADLGEEMAVYEAALEAHYGLAGQNTPAAMVQRLRTQAGFLRTVLYPVDPINFHASYAFAEGSSGGGGEDGTGVVAGDIFVDAWSTTRTPVVVEGFEFSNGLRLSASGYLASDPDAVRVLAAGGVVLPPDGRTVRFRFPMNERLANLENVQQVLAAARAQGAARDTLDLDVDALFRPLAATAVQSEALRMRRVDPNWESEDGRPDPPTLAEALAKHACLEFRPASGQLFLRPGNWDVDGDLIVPSGYTLHASPNVRLRFDEDAVLLTDAPLVFEGVTLEPKPGLERWRGIAVLGASGRSTWKSVVVRKTDAVARAGWIVTGGITFYHSPVTMLDCVIDGTLAEDGTNIFGCDFLMERVTFRGCVSDSFDGDFVTGIVRDCLFTEGLADGVDFSGSDVTVENCRFIDMGDKGVSAGENSIVRVYGGICDQVSIGIASKDRSRVDARDMTIRGARNYALAAFVKKPEFGPTQMVVENVTIEGSGLGDQITQTGSTLVIDGVEQPTQDLDVKQLYEDKILGQ